MRLPLAFALSPLAWAYGCLDPLPDPTECAEPASIVVGRECMSCPLSAPVPYERCVPQAFLGGQPLGVGCLGQHGELWRYGCLVGPDAETECACDESASGRAAPACFDDACPPRVTEVAPGAQCVRDGLEAEFVDLQGVVGCTCRCASELLRCDGKGVSFGALTDATTRFDLPYVTMKLPDDLPSEGRLGFYVRMRGFAAPMVIAVAEPRSFPFSFARSYGFYSIGEYVELIGLGAKEDGINLASLDEEPYAWSDDAGRPRTIVVYPPPLVGDGGLHISEIDCVIPFVLPP